jgi:hypothetical protein
MASWFNAHNQREAHMDALIEIGQIASLVALAYGAYLSLKNAYLADPERARTASSGPDQPTPPATQTGHESTGCIVSH